MDPDHVYFEHLPERTIKFRVGEKEEEIEVRNQSTSSLLIKAGK